MWYTEVMRYHFVATFLFSKGKVDSSEKLNIFASDSIKGTTRKSFFFSGLINNKTTFVYSDLFYFQFSATFWRFQCYIGKWKLSVKLIFIIFETNSKVCHHIMDLILFPQFIHFSHSFGIFFVFPQLIDGLFCFCFFLFFKLKYHCNNFLFNIDDWIETPLFEHLNKLSSTNK